MKEARPVFDRSVFLDLLKIGFPIFVSGYIISFLNTVPRLMLLKFGTVELLGLYSPLLAVITAIAVIPDSIAAYLYPKMSYAIGKTNDKEALWKKSLYSHLGLFFLGIPLVLICLLVVPWLIDNVIPKYSASKGIINIGIFTALFMSYRIGYTTLVTLKNWRMIIIYVSVFSIVQIIFPYILIISIKDVLKAVVIGQMISAAFMAMVSLATSYLATHTNKRLALPHFP